MPSLNKKPRSKASWDKSPEENEFKKATTQDEVWFPVQLAKLNVILDRAILLPTDIPKK